MTKKYLSGKYTGKKINSVKITNRKEFDRLIHDEWNSNNTDSVSKHKEDSLWLSIESKILTQESKKTKKLYKKNNKTLNLLKYAAIFIGIILLSSTFYRNSNKIEPILNQVPILIKQNQITIEFGDGTSKTLQQTKQKHITNTNGDIIAQQKENKLVYNETDKKNTIKNQIFNTLRVPYGKKFQIVLSDGSEVYLNSGSSLKYPTKFISGKTREVFLEGEGYFDIAKNKNDSFIVNTHDLSTKVFGTKFNISSYGNEELVKVVLIEGSVSVYKTSNTNLQNKIKPNQIASYEKNKSKISVNSVDISSHIAWIDNVLLFKNENFNTIINKLERHFDILIINNYSKLENEKFTGRFKIENIDEVLNTFKKTIKFSYKKNENKIIINP